MSGTGQGAVPADELEEYLDALLRPAVAAPARIADTPPGERRYRLVTAAGLKFALPDADVRVPAGGDAMLAAGSTQVVDLAAIVTGRPGAAAPTDACSGGAGGAGGVAGEADAVYLSLPAFPGYALRVDGVAGCIAVALDAVRWRKAAQVRPWLTGMIEAAGAAVLEVGELVREARHGD